MPTKNASARGDGLLARILSSESYFPAEPTSIADTGLPVSLIESLLIKRLALTGMSSGRKLAEQVCLPFRILEEIYQSLRARQVLVHKSAAPLNDYHYVLTDLGRDLAQAAMQACSYVGPAPVPLVDYVISAEAQSIRAEAPRREQLEEAFRDISIDDRLFECLGPAINSGAGLFLYGSPGNGKSTLARRITMCFGQRIWIPHVIVEDGQIIKFFDAGFHEVAEGPGNAQTGTEPQDRRWLKIRRPTVVVGGELTMDGLEIRHDPRSNVSEAPLQMKSNCGCLLIDDFGRQRIEPTELLNRWIVPLENRVDYLTLSTGKKIQVPFEQLIIFSTNLEPSDLVDEAFMRRIPYKIEIGDPSDTEYLKLFEHCAAQFGCEFRPKVIEALLAKHYHAVGRVRRRCHPRDLMLQVRNFCAYHDLPVELREDYFDRIVGSYFTEVIQPKTMNGITPPAGTMATPPGFRPLTVGPAVVPSGGSLAGPAVAVPPVSPLAAIPRTMVVPAAGGPVLAAPMPPPSTVGRSIVPPRPMFATPSADTQQPPMGATLLPGQFTPFGAGAASTEAPQPIPST